MEEKTVEVAKDAKSSISNSKQKRIEREKANQAAKRNKLIGNIISVVVVVAVIGVIVAAAVSAIIKSQNTIKASDDYSAQVDEYGFIKGVKTADYIQLCDYKNIKVPLSEVEYSDESVEADIQNQLEANKVLVTEDVEIKDGDTVNIDYVGSIEGVEFEGGNSNGAGSDLVIGSGSFIDDFEQQLIGYKPGEIVTVNVTFPEEYQAEELAGKDAEFVVTINGVYVIPEFDDDFVCANLSEFATTADGYRQYLKDTNLDSKLTEYVSNYISENSTLIKYPKKFLKNVKETSMNNDYQSYEYMNELYIQYNGSGIGSFEEYVGKSEEEYLAELSVACEQTVKDDLVYQAILEQEGIKPSVEDLKKMVEKNYGSGEESYNNLIEQYGQGYMMLSVIAEKAVEIAKSYAVVE